MSREAVFSEAPGGGSDRFYLDQFGQVTGLTLDYNYPGGADTLSCNLAADPRLSHRALAPGRYIGVLSGGHTCWRGHLEEPAPGVPWSITAAGIGQQGANFVAYCPTSNNALNLNEAVDGAIDRGLNWVRNGSLPTVSGQSTTSGSQTVADSLTSVCNMIGSYWAINDRGAITVNTPPNGVQYCLLGQTRAGGRSSGGGFATSVAVQWVSINTQKSVTTIYPNTDSVAQFGTIETTLDLTQNGAMNLATSQAAAQNWLALNSPRTYFADPFTVNAGQLLTFGGQPMDLAAARPGQRLRVHWVDLDPFGEIDPTQPIDIMIGHTSYDSDAETLEITPLDHAQRTLNENGLFKHSPEYRRMKARLAAQAKAKKEAAARHAAYLRWYKRTHHGHLPPVPKKRKPAPKRK